TLVEVQRPDLPTVPLPQVQLPESDGIPLETLWHQAQILLLVDVVNLRYDERQDFFVGGNIFLYYNVQQVRNKDYRGPDFFFVNGVNRFPVRKCWAVWEEQGRYPNLIIEFLSESTEKTDRTTKKDLYEKTFRTPEYFSYDPESNKVEGWHLDGNLRYQPLPP